MQHPYNVLAPEYEKQMERARLIPSRIKELDLACNGLLKHEDLYQELSDKSGVPTAFLMALSQREMSGNVNCYLGNGQRLNMRTTIVPKGRGPFKNFVEGGMDALILDGLTKINVWSWSRVCYEGELWNGFGYRSKSVPTPYLWGATSVQRPGKFIADHVFDYKEMDQQLGIIAIMEELINRDASLAFVGDIPKIDAPSIVPSPAPDGIGGNFNVYILQMKLNALMGPGTPLKVDGNFGKATKRAVVAFQTSRHLTVDGVVGNETMKALLGASK